MSKKEKDRETPEARRIKFTEHTAKIIEGLSREEADVTKDAIGGLQPTAVLCNTIDIKTRSDRVNPCLYDLTVLLVDGEQTIVVTDWDNKSVKSFFTRNNKPCHSQLFLNHGPFGVTSAKDDHVMVAVPDSYNIITVKVSSELELISTTKTGKRYLGLTFLGRTSIAVSTSSPCWCVDILDMCGEVLVSVTTSGNIKLFDLPWYMCVSNRGKILVSDIGKESVICLTPEGVVLWTYTIGDFGDLRGITVSPSGGILVADKRHRKVIQLTESGMYDKTILTSRDGLTEPDAIFFDSGGSLFVCDKTYLKEFIFKNKQ